MALLRHARPGDDGLLYTLFAANAAGRFQALDPAVLGPLLEMQYRARELTYTRQYPDAVNWMVCTDGGQAVGRHLVERQQSALHGIDLAILPEWQGKGLGTAALRSAQQQCREEGIAFHLRVVKGNPALRLYERLDFKIATEDDVSYEMVWHYGDGY